MALLMYGLAYGQEIPGEGVKRWLREPVESQRFRMACSRIRAALEPEGFYLRSDTRTGGFRVVTPSENVKKVQSRNRVSRRLTRRALILAESTRTEGLTDLEKHLLEHEKAKAAHMEAMARRRVLV